MTTKSDREFDILSEHISRSAGQKARFAKVLLHQLCAEYVRGLHFTRLLRGRVMSCQDREKFQSSLQPRWLRY